MDNTCQQFKRKTQPLGFLSIVTFLMVLIGIGYTVSTALAKSPDARAEAISSNSEVKNADFTIQNSSQSQGSFFSSFEQIIADKAIALFNEFSTTGNSTSSSDFGNETWTSDSFVLPSTVAQVVLASSSSLPEVYEDIATSPFQSEILNLYSNGLVVWGKSFYPGNSVRVSDFIRVVMDAYRLQQWIDPNSLEGRSNNHYFVEDSFPSEVLLRVNSAYEAWFLQKLALYDANHHLRLSAFISPSEAQEILRLMALKSPNLVENPPDLSFQSASTLRKDEMAKLIVDCFHLQVNQHSLPAFSDIYWSKYQDAIQALANLWIVWWVNGKFYPDAYLESKDFAIMLSRILLMQQGISQVPIDNFYYLTTLKNVNLSTIASYTPYLEYCLEHEMCTTLLSQTPWGVTFQANKQLHFSDVISQLSNLTSTTLLFPTHGDREWITRWEAAYLLFQVITTLPSTSATSAGKIDTTSESSSFVSSLRTRFQELMRVS